MRNLTQKIIDSHCPDLGRSANSDLRLSVDQILIEDATGTMTAMQFEELGLDGVRVPLAVMYVDHNVLQIDDKNMQDHQYLQTFSERYGIRYCTPGSGIAHYVHLERFASPGQVLVGADSHTSTAGSMGMLAIGAGGLEVAVAMGGYGFDTATPQVVGVELQGRLPKWAQAKDVILELLRRYGVRGGRGKIFEFYGEGVSTLSVPERATICNMIIETGATTGIFPSDAATESWLSDMGREGEFIERGPDPGATYDSYEPIYLPEIVPLIALPPSPGNVVPVSEVEGTRVVQVCVGSSVNSSYEDLACVAEILKGRKLADGVQLTVTPGSKSILQEIIVSGVYQALAVAGARMLEPICGPCIGIGQAPVAHEASLRTFNRNFPGRSGTAEDAVYLCSPATAGWSAVYGHITDPSSHEDISITPSPFRGDYVNDTLITEARPLHERLSVEVIKGSNLVAPRFGLKIVDSFHAVVVASVGDDVSTGDMTPDGAIAMSVWSNIEACSKFMFNRLDSGFYDRARAADYGIIVGGENYGQGSSREHAALVPMHLGVRIVAAKSFARIHRRNLISSGIVPLVLPEDVPNEATGVDTRWEVRGLGTALSSGDEEFVIVAHVRGEHYKISSRIDLTDGERETLLAGGLLTMVRRGDRLQL